MAASTYPHSYPKTQHQKTHTHTSTNRASFPASSRGRMRLWKRASGAFKDRTSLWQANLSRRTAFRNPDVEKAIIRATTHHESSSSSFDPRHVNRVCEWVRLSRANLKPILWPISNRMEKTRSWVVAIKGLFLMHTIVNCGAPGVDTIGRLPFDLSNFHDGHLRQRKAWPFNAVVRAYYAFLDQKSTISFQHAEDHREPREFAMLQELVLLQKLQNLVELVMQIKPVSTAAEAPLVVFVMDAIILEIYDLYSKICRGVAHVLVNIYSAGRAEAVMALNIVQKAANQAEDMMYYFEYCKQIGVVKANEFPVIDLIQLDRIPDEGIQELKQIIINFKSDKLDFDETGEEKAIVVKNSSGLRTIITDKWEKFEEDYAAAAKNPFGSPGNVHGNKVQELPDLMTFF